MRLRKLQEEKRKIRRRHKGIYEAAKKRNASHDEMQFFAIDEMGELDDVDEAIAGLQTDFLRDRADALLIPVPEFDAKGPDWIVEESGHRWFLSLAARAALRERIHDVEMGIWERRTKWVILLIGLIGAITGLVSVWNK